MGNILYNILEKQPVSFKTHFLSFLSFVCLRHIFEHELLSHSSLNLNEILFDKESTDFLIISQETHFWGNNYKKLRKN